MSVSEIIGRLRCVRFCVNGLVSDRPAFVFAVFELFDDSGSGECLFSATS